MTVPVPATVDERLHALDVLRGLALFGMILVHFHQRVRAEATGIEDLIGWGVYIFVEQKAWGTFALLFGAGFAILLQRLESRGQPVVVIYLRRLAMLAAFGVLVDLAFGFQILCTYAVWGLPLLVLRRWPTPALLLTAALAASARPIAMLDGTWVTSYAAAAPLRAAVTAAAERGSYTALFSARWALFAGSFPHSWRDVLPDVNLALFIIGLLAIRHGVVAEPKRHVRTIVGWMTFGAVSWAIAWTYRSLLGIVQDQWLCFTYAGAIVLLLAFRPAWKARLAVFGVSGRMALTNYVVQAAMLDFLSSAYGAGLKLRPYVYPLAAVALFAAVAVFSRTWLARYRFGPLEWVWRTVTYARVQPLRRSGPVVAVEAGGLSGGSR
jgi:uncharacterized protein